jgi:hypothetical protein
VVLQHQVVLSQEASVDQLLQRVALKAQVAQLLLPLVQAAPAAASDTQINLEKSSLGFYRGFFNL